jgi:hypothetical protein
MASTGFSKEPPPIRPDVLQLFQSIEKMFASTSLGPDRWYLLALAALVGGTEHLLADQLYLYITSKPDCQQSTERQALVRRLRETLVKLISIIGVCKPLESILAIAKVEQEEDRDYTSTRFTWAADSANNERGMSWFRKIYSRDSDKMLELFDAHKDFAWISTEISYGLYLSDRQVLDDWDTELVVLVGIAIQNLPLPMRWHLRGARRIGMELGDVKTIMECVRVVGRFMGTKLDRLPEPEEVEGEI